MNGNSLDQLRGAYLELIKKSLMDVIHYEKFQFVPIRNIEATGFKLRMLKIFDRFVKRKQLMLVKNVPSDFRERMQGKGVWPQFAETMIGIDRLNNIQNCIQDTILNNVPGDLMETGVWRGGATIFMRAVLRAYGINDKIVWAADSFEGLPKPDEIKYPADEGYNYHQFNELKVSLDDVKNNFAKYGLLDNQVQFLKGWFKDTLPTAPIKKLSILRLDGDLYESTMDALVNLYPKVSIGGYVIVDDYGWIEACRRAVEDYRKKYHVTDQITKVDWTCVYWKKSK